MIWVWIWGLMEAATIIFVVLTLLNINGKLNKLLFQLGGSKNTAEGEAQLGGMKRELWEIREEIEAVKIEIGILQDSIDELPKG